MRPKMEIKQIIYITGAGEKYFSSGNDLLNYFPKGDYDPVALLENATNTVEEFFKAFVDFPKIVAVGVNGHAIGVAVTILGLVDLVYASEKASFVTPFTKLALVA